MVLKSQDYYSVFPAVRTHIFKGSVFQAGAQQSLGDLLVVLSAVSYSVYVITIKPLMARYNAMHILQWVFLFGTFFSLPIGWNALGKVQWSAFDGWSWFALLIVL
jgi:drug/metabolite transporter (DMT)-like permease